MNTLSDSVKILDALEVYFESISSYLRNNDAPRYQHMTELIERASQIKKELLTVKVGSMEGAFQVAHLYATLGSLMRKVYDGLDFQIPVGDDITRTRAYKLMSVFDDITNVYRVYVKELESRTSKVVGELMPGLDMKAPVTDVQKIFHRFPMSIDLYVKYMNRRLETADKDTQAAIMQIIEVDKSHALGEPKWTSPYLSFGLKPLEGEHAGWLTVAQLAALIGSKSESVAKLATPTIGVVAWHRVQRNNLVYHLPQSLDFTRGICTDDKFTPMENVASQKNGEPWDVKVYNQDAKNFLCIETLDGKNWRVLSHNRLLTERATIAKLINRHNGRPRAYNLLMEHYLKKNISAPLRGAFNAELPKMDIQAHVQKIHAAFLRWFQEQKGTVEERIKSAGVTETIRELIIQEIETPEIETLLYSLETLETQFMKDLGKRRMPDTSQDEKMIWFAAQSKEILTSLIKRRENIFQILYQKAYLKSNIKYNVKK